VIAGFGVRALFHEQRWLDAPTQSNVSMKTLVDQIIISESQGNPAAKNLYSSAMGLGQFVEGTWLDLVKRHRPDIAATLNEKQILELRDDPELSRFMTGRYVQQNTSILTKRGLPVTPGSLYLAHFAGPAGAAAILAAPENADAATVIANVDHRPGVTREKIVSGNPFMKNFTAKDLRNWADLKMQRLKFNASASDDKSTPRSD
jgi:Transglycosylase SLT domain